MIQSVDLICRSAAWLELACCHLQDKHNQARDANETSSSTANQLKTHMCLASVQMSQYALHPWSAAHQPAAHQLKLACSFQQWVFAALDMIIPGCCRARLSLPTFSSPTWPDMAALMLERVIMLHRSAAIRHAAHPYVQENHLRPGGTPAALPDGQPAAQAWPAALQGGPRLCRSSWGRRLLPGGTGTPPVSSPNSER